MHNYSGLDLKKILLSSNKANCVPDGIIVNMNGSVTFNILHKTNCTLFVTKVSGLDTHILINGVLTALPLGKECQLNLNDITQLVVAKNKNSFGFILISRVIFEADSNENYDIFYKLGKTNGITADTSGVYANEYAQIYEKDRIERLETFPPNSYIIKDTIVFTRPAKIIDVKLKDNGNKMAEVYSCDNLSIFANGNDLKASGTNLIMERGSCLGIRDVCQNSGKSYILELGLSNIIGNGIFTIQSLSNDKVVGTQNGILFNNSCRIYKFKLDFTNTNSIYFNIFREPNSTTGSILIHSVKLFGEEVGNSIQVFDNKASKDPTKVPKDVQYSLSSIKKYKSTILITAYRRAHLLKYGLDSINRQSFNRDDVEIVVLDDYGDPDTLNVCKNFEGLLNIRYMYTFGNKEQWRTPGFAINYGIRRTDSKYIFISCAEMFHMDETINLMTEALDNNNKVLTICNGKDDNGIILRKLSSNEKVYDYEFDPLITLNTKLPFFMGMNRSDFVSIGGYDEDFIGCDYDDNDIVDRMLAYGNTFYNINCRIIHVQHQRLAISAETRSRQAYNNKLYTERQGQIVRNQNKDWGMFNNIKEYWRDIPLEYGNSEGAIYDASIIIASYKRPDLLDLGLESIKNQAINKKIEIIVVNDGVDDNTKDICRKYSRDLNVRYVFTGQRNIDKEIWRIPGYAYNIGVKLAKGKNICLSCAEMFHIGTVIDRCIEKVNCGNNTVAVPTVFNDKGSFKNDRSLQGLLELDNKLPYFLCMPRDNYINIGGYDEDFTGITADDNDFVERLHAAGFVYSTVDASVVHLYHQRMLKDDERTPASEDKAIIDRIMYNRDLLAKRRIERSKNPSLSVCNRNKNWGFGGEEYYLEQWYFNVPKVIHFYWGGHTISYLRYLSYLSFKKMNPLWRIKIHQPVQVSQGKTWRTPEQSHSKEYEDYTSKVAELGCEFVTHNMETYGMSNGMHEVHKSDMIRWKLLAEEGGVWSDNDIIYFKPISKLLENTRDNLGKDSILCMYNDVDSVHAIGFMMSSGNNPLFKFLSDSARKRWKMTEYQSIGNALLESYKKTSRLNEFGVDSLFLDECCVYPTKDINNLLSDTVINKDSIGLHWYGGHPSIAKFENSINESNVAQYNNTITKAIKLGDL